MAPVVTCTPSRKQDCGGLASGPSQVTSTSKYPLASTAWSPIIPILAPAMTEGPRCPWNCTTVASHAGSDGWRMVMGQGKAVGGEGGQRDSQDQDGEGFHGSGSFALHFIACPQVGIPTGHVMQAVFCLLTTQAP